MINSCGREILASYRMHGVVLSELLLFIAMRLLLITFLQIKWVAVKSCKEVVDLINNGGKISMQINIRGWEITLDRLVH